MGEVAAVRDERGLAHVATQAELAPVLDELHLVSRRTRTRLGRVICPLLVTLALVLRATSW